MGILSCTYMGYKVTVPLNPFVWKQGYQHYLLRILYFISSTLCPRNLYPLPSSQNAQKSNGWYGHCRPLCRRCILSPPNVMELTLMTTDTPQLPLMVMQNLLPPMAHHLHPITNQLPLMGNHNPHMENQLQLMELKKQLCLTLLQSSLES